MKKAFTLLELIIVLGIISIILSVAVLKVTGLNSSIEEKELEAFVSDLDFARRYALASRSRVSVVLNEDNAGYRIEGKDKDLIKEVNLESIKVYKLNSVEKGDLVFLKTGTVANPRTYLIRGSEDEYQVSIQIATGKVNLKNEKK